MEQTTHTGGKNIVKGARAPRRKIFSWTKSSSKTDDDDECLQVTRPEFGAILSELKKTDKKLTEAIEESMEAKAREFFGKMREQDLEWKVNALQEELKREKLRSAQRKQENRQPQRKLKTILPRYKMSSRPRGICVIINNINFHGGHKREGAELDEVELDMLYSELLFMVHIFRDLQWDEMRKVADQYAKEDHSQFDAFVVIVMSHGGDRDTIYGVRGRPIRVEDLMAEFKAANCPSLRNKPKLFMIQTCRGSSDESLSPAFADSDIGVPFSPESTLARSVCPQEADFLLSFATAPGYKAWRYKELGSPYIQILVEEIRKHHESYHLLDILTEVNRRVVKSGINRDRAAIQCPAPTHTLQAQVYL